MALESGRVRCLTLCGILLLLTIPRIGLAQDSAAYFQANCASCHSIGGGALVGPDLKNVQQRKDRKWLLKFLDNPQAVIDSGDPYAKKMLGGIEWRGHATGERPGPRPRPRRCWTGSRHNRNRPVRNRQRRASGAGTCVHSRRCRPRQGACDGQPDSGQRRIALYFLPRVSRHPHAGRRIIGAGSHPRIYATGRRKGRHSLA